MSFHKMTTIFGRKAGYVEPTAPAETMERHRQVEANRPHTFIATLNGHWKPESAWNYARRQGVVSDVEVTHSTGDLSGKGRGGYDRSYIVTDDEIRERPLTPTERDYNDAETVNDLWDEIESR